jgi:hypothetical protein
MSDYDVTAVLLDDRLEDGKPYAHKKGGKLCGNFLARPYKCPTGALFPLQP